jgi:superfamily I DNA and RNA helicase
MNETWWVGEDQLDADQKKIIALKLKGSHIIAGPPGSGKTNLLLLRARYMILAGQPNIQVIVFTRTLQEFMAVGGAEYQLPEGSVKTSIRWCSDFLYEHGIKANLKGNFDDLRARLISEVQDLMDKKKLRDVYECVFLDEAQDYLPEEIEVFKRLGKVIFAAVDSRQKIYSGKDVYALLADGAEEHYLRFHYRLGEKICRLADGIMGNDESSSLLKTSKYNESARPSSVDQGSFKDLDRQAESIVERLKVQIAAYPDEMIGVICPYNNQLEKIWTVLEASEVGKSAIRQAADNRVPFDTDRPICLCTIHSAKGLEFRALHVAGVENLSDWPNHLNLTYTAVTRAKTALSLYYSDNITGYLKQALQGLNPAPDLPPIADVFPKGKH